MPSVKRRMADTSLAAHEDSKLTAEDRMEAVRAAVKAAGTTGLTREELAVRTKRPLQSICGTVRSALDDGLIFDSGHRRATQATGSMAAVLVSEPSWIKHGFTPTKVRRAHAAEEHAKRQVAAATRAKEAALKAASTPIPAGHTFLEVKDADGSVIFAGVGRCEALDQAQQQIMEARVELAKARAENAAARDLAARFWALVSVGAEDACWHWNGALNSEGTGVFKVAGQGIRAKRLAVELSAPGGLADGVQVGVCEHDLLCVNPKHLTPRERARPGVVAPAAPDPRQQDLLPESYPCLHAACGKTFDTAGQRAQHALDTHP